MNMHMLSEVKQTSFKPLGVVSISDGIATDSSSNKLLSKSDFPLRRVGPRRTRDFSSAPIVSLLTTRNGIVELIENFEMTILSPRVSRQSQNLNFSRKPVGT